MKRDKALAVYLLWAFGGTWFFDVLLIMIDRQQLLNGNMILSSVLLLASAAAPGIGTYQAWKQEGFQGGFKAYCKRMTGEGSWWIRFLIVLGVMFLMLVLNFLLFVRSDAKWFMFILYIPYMCFGGGVEELGWRGFLQPHLEQKIGFIGAFIIMGLTWACWHIPLWFISTTAQQQENFLVFIVLCIGLSGILGMARQLTKSTVACIIIHAWSNVLFSMFVYHMDTIHMKTVVAFFSYAAIAILFYYIDYFTGKTRRSRR